MRLILFLIAALLLISCGKKNETELPPTGGGGCFLGGYRSGAGNLYSLRFMNDGLTLASIYGDGRTLSFDYSESQILTQSTDTSGELISRDTFIINAEGRIVQRNHRVYNGPGSSTSFYAYDLGGSIARDSVIVYDPTNPYTLVRNFTWQDGDMVLEVSGSNPADTIHYEYNQNLNTQRYDATALEQLHIYGAVRFPNRHLLKRKSSSGAEINYEYTLPGVDGRTLHSFIADRGNARDTTWFATICP